MLDSVKTQPKRRLGNYAPVYQQFNLRFYQGSGKMQYNNLKMLSKKTKTLILCQKRIGILRIGLKSGEKMAKPLKSLKWKKN